MNIKENIVKVLSVAFRAKTFVVASAIAIAMSLSPLQPMVTTLAYEGEEGFDSQTEEVAAAEDTEVTSETEIVDTALPEDTAVTDYSEYAIEEPAITESEDVEVAEPTETIDTTAPPTEETEAAVETTETEVASEAETEPSETTVEETTSETTVAEDQEEDVIIRVNDADAYLEAVASMPSGDKLIVQTTDDLSVLNADAGVYFDGTYILWFEDTADFDNAVDYVNAEGYEYSEDGDMGVCGNFNSVFSFGAINPNAKVKVAVIDTGSNLANEAYSVLGTDTADYNGHGTAMCNFVLNETSDAYIISIKAIDTNGKGNVSDVYAAVQLADELNVDYILMAISIRDNGEYDAFKTLIEDTKATIVAAAGNNGTNASAYIPAGLDGVISVGAIGDGNVLRSFSNYGTCVDYYEVADSTSEASAKVLGKLIAGKDVMTVAFRNDDSDIYYYKGSELYFETCYTIQNTKVIYVLDEDQLGGATADEFRNGKGSAIGVVARAAYYANTDRRTWANGCIEFVKQMYNWTLDSDFNTSISSSKDPFKFNSVSSGCTTSMNSLGYSNPASVGITGLRNTEDVDACISDGRALYDYVTANAKPGDILMFGYPADSSTPWHHAAIYQGTGTEMFGGSAQPAIVVYEAPGNGYAGQTRAISAADLHQWYGDTSKWFSSVVILSIKEGPKTSKLSLTKSSSVPAVTNGNSCYDLNGTTYVLYSDQACTKSVATFKVDSKGATSTTYEATRGTTYYLKETVAGKGYKVDSKTYTVTVATDGTVTVNNGVTVNVSNSISYMKFTDDPLSDPIFWTLKKEDPYNWNLATGNTLAGAVFTIDYYDRTDIRTESDIAKLNSDTPKASVTLTSSQVTASKAGIINIDIDSLTAADKSGYFSSFGSSLRALPVGTYRVTETTAPYGYKVADTTKPLVFSIFDNNGIVDRTTIASTIIYNAASASEIIMNEYPLTGLVAPSKSASDPTKLITGLHSLAGTQYGIFYKNNDNLACVVTFDDNGKLSDVDYAAGITPPTGFFKQTIELPIGDYYAKEITAGRWFQLDSNTYEFSIKAGDTTNLDLKDKEVPPPTMHTTATDADTGTHYLSYKERVTITDEVAYEGLVLGESYTVTGTLYDAATGETYKDSEGNTYTKSVVFTPSTANGTVDVVFTDVLVPFEKTTLVVFENLYENQNNICIATHADLTDKNQTVERRVPELHTTAMDTDTGTHYLSYKERVTIKDEVEYTNLNPGESYAVTGTLYDAATGETYKDSEGNTYTKSVVFTPSTANGTVDVVFTDVLVPFEKTTLVVFENLYESTTKVLIATHADLTDKGQTVERRVPELHTTATDADNGTHTLTYKERVTIKDEVEYTNLNAGESYTVTGTLYDAATGETYKDSEGNTYTKSVVFTPSTANGTVDVVFTDVLVPFEKTTLVVFENLYESTTKVLIATHADLTDENQTVRRPTAGTTATILNAKDVWLGTTEVQKLTISDTIAYAGLEVGTTYRAEATLYKSDGTQFMVDGQPIKSILEFTPTTSDGKVVVDITFSTEGLAEGDKIVVFEKIYDVKAGVLVAVHEDLTDEGQTVTIHFRPMTGSIVPSYSVAGSVIAVVATAIAGVWFFISRRKKYSES